MSEPGPRLISGLHAEYKRADWDGNDTSGIRAIGSTVLILCDECAELTSGGVALPIDLVEKMNMAAEQGVIVRIAEGAFKVHKSGHKWSDAERPQVGNRVYFQKYAGVRIRGKDKRVYMLMEDTCVGAIYDDDPEEAQQREAA